jgi:hypothetical protein
VWFKTEKERNHTKEQAMTTRIMWIDTARDEELREFIERGMIPAGIPIDELGESNSCMLIQTVRSIYLFLGSTPADPRGQLVGGKLGEAPVSAFLIGGISTSNAETEDPTALTTGARAVFHIQTTGGCKRIVTSPILKLVHTQIRPHESLGTVH